MILTPKEEAEKIVNKFIDVIPFNQEVDINKFMKVDVLCAIECALIAVDKILQIFNNEWTKLDFWTEEINGTINFWQEVKQILEKLKKCNKMILTDKTIIDEITEGNIVIEPFNPENLGTNSYDLTLSNTLVVYTERVLDVRKKNPSTSIIIPDEGIILQPGIVYLASTVEYTETMKHVPIIQGKSSLGRLGLFVHVTAGFGDVGFKGHWTLELLTVQPLKIYPGMKIAQLTYQDISEMPNISYDKKQDAKYSNQGKDPVASKNYLNK